MSWSRTLGAGVSFLALLAASAVPAQREGPGAGPAALDPDAFEIRLLLGVNDDRPVAWNGRVSVDQGEVLGVEGYRFRDGDAVDGRDAWKASSRFIRRAAAKKAQAKAKAVAKAKAKAQAQSKEVGGAATSGPAVAPNGVIVALKAPGDATLNVQTEQGRFDVKLADLARGGSKAYLDGKVRADRVLPHVPLADGPGQEDFPAAASDGGDGLWVAYVAHKPRGPEVLSAFSEAPKDFAAFAPTGGGDQVKLVRVEKGRPGTPVDVTPEGLDVWRPAVAVDGQGRVVVAWSENRDGNFDLYRRVYDPKTSQWSEPKRLTENPGADAHVALAVDPDGRVWMAWQAWEDGRASVLANPVEQGAEGARRATDGKANAWSPAIAIDSRGTVYVGCDVYEGDYNVVVAKFTSQNADIQRTVVAGGPNYEARPSLALDGQGRLWVAYEERTPNWGKDAENLVKGQGSTLYARSDVRVACLSGGEVLQAPDPVANAPVGVRGMNGMPRLATDARGRVYLAFRHRQEGIWGNNAVMVVGGVWVEYVTSLAGPSWEPPLFVPRSDGLLDNRPALVGRGDRGPLLVYNSDGRLHREVEFTPDLAAKYYTHSGTPPGVVNNDLFLAAVPAPEAAGEPSLARRGPAPAPASPVHPDEAEDVARVRDYRVEAGGKTYRLLRGDFHRHTEVSQDGSNDGALEDMWRYAIDAAGLDWIGNADHDNGGGKEYTWWLVQKTTDLYHSPTFNPMFTYERSVVYPHGHRNVMFPKRGVRTLPRLVADRQVVDADTAMLYRYLDEHGGICASHTSATGMGTDWRDVDPAFEPIVEIFQGHRNSYEHLGAPRVARRPGEAIGGWRPLGMVWNALALQYRFGFQASSDHVSTHISYAVAVAESATRGAIFDAFKRRHCYGATDNIVLDVRSGDHLMGDEFDAPAGGPVKLKVLVHGTRPVAKVDVIKDFVYVYSTEPNKPRVEFEWADTETRGPGLSWYYVRATQDDGQLAWASPIWVRFNR